MSRDPAFASLLDRLRRGDPDAAAQVFHTFVRRLVGLAASHLDALIRHKVGPEDVAQSVFKSFFIRQRRGEFDLADWEGLWELLALITVRKCCNHAAYYQAACRDVHREASSPADSQDTGDGWQFVDREPTPEESLILAETLGQLLQSFTGREREIIELGLQGLTVTEITTRLGCTESKVYRVLRRVRQKLQSPAGSLG